MSSESAVPPVGSEPIEPKQSRAVTIAAPRLGYPAGLEEKFGVDRSAWKALVEAVFPNAQSPDSVVLALSYCRARRLDPFKRVVHIVPIYDRERKRMVETVWPGIAELRTTAFRTGQYAGADPTAFGPSIKLKFRDDGSDRRAAAEHEVAFPEWAQVTVYRMLGAVRVAFPGPRVYWTETYSTIGRTDVPNDRWRRAPSQMLEKCAEAAALRKAFPEEMGDQGTDDEAGGVTHGRQMVDVTPGADMPQASVEPVRETPKAIEQKTEAPIPQADVARQAQPMPAETTAKMSPKNKRAMAAQAPLQTQDAPAAQAMPRDPGGHFPQDDGLKVPAEFDRALNSRAPATAQAPAAKPAAQRPAATGDDEVDEMFGRR